MVSFEAAHAVVAANPDHDVEVPATNAVFTLENEPGASLPSTSGPGTTLIFLFGIMFTGLAETGLVARKRRRAAE